MNSEFQLFPEQASTVAGQVDAIFIALLVMSAFFSLLIAGLIFYFAIRFRRERMPLPGRPVPPMSLEVAWTLIPLALTLGLFGWGSAAYMRIQQSPAGAMTIDVVGKQWMWKFQHPDGRREINELHIPVGRTVQLTMISEDVIHSLYVPAFRIKQDVLPGRYTSLWFQATKPGQFHLFCAEYCGTKHSEMVGRVVVLDPARYERWLAGESVPATTAEQGAFLLAKLKCDNCHQQEGSQRGPRLTGRFGTSVALQGSDPVPFDASYIRESILNPKAKIVAGYPPIMPTYEGQISEEEIMTIIQYLKESQPDSSMAPFTINANLSGS